MYFKACYKDYSSTIFEKCMVTPNFLFGCLHFLHYHNPGQKYLWIRGTVLNTCRLQLLRFSLLSIASLSTRLLTCLHTNTYILPSIFSPLEMISLNIWEIITPTLSNYYLHSLNTIKAVWVSVKYLKWNFSIFVLVEHVEHMICI